MEVPNISNTRVKICIDMLKDEGETVPKLEKETQYIAARHGMMGCNNTHEATYHRPRTHNHEQSHTYMYIQENKEHNLPSVCLSTPASCRSLMGCNNNVTPLKYGVTHVIIVACHIPCPVAKYTTLVSWHTHIQCIFKSIEK